MRGRGVGSRAGMRGFSALELVGVMCVIAFVALAILRWGVGVNARARSVSCNSNLRQIALALAMYADDHGGRLPASSDAVPTIEASYTKNWQLLRCPVDADPVMVHFEDGDFPVSYFIVPGLANDNPPTTVVAGDTEARHDSAWNAVCLDGHVRPLPSAELKPYRLFAMKGKREHETQAQGVHAD